MDVDPNTLTHLWLVIAYIVFVWTNDAIGAKNTSRQNQYMNKFFDGFSSFELFVKVLVNCLSKHGSPDLVNDYMFYATTVWILLAQ